MLKSCTSITAHNTGSDGWEKGDGRLGGEAGGLPPFRQVRERMGHPAKPGPPARSSR